MTFLSTLYKANELRDKDKSGQFSQNPPVGFQEVLSLPHLRTDIIEQIVNEFNSQTPINQVLDRYNLHLPSSHFSTYHLAKVRELRQAEFKQMPYNEYFDMTVFFSIFANFYEKNDKITSDNYSFLMDSLLQCFPSYNTITIEKMFKLLLNSVMNRSDFTWNERALAITETFFVRDEKLDSSYSPQLVSFINILSQKKKLDQLFSLLRKLFTTKRPLVSGDHQSDIISSIKEYIDELNGNAMELLGIFGTLNDPDGVVSQMFRTLPSKLLSYQMQEQPREIVPDHKPSNGGYNNLQSSTFSFTFISPPLKSFAEGLSDLPADLQYQGTEIFTHLSPKLLDVMEKIYIALMNTSMTMQKIFFEQLESLVNGLQNNQYYYDILCDLLYVSEKIGPGKLWSEGLNIDLIFDYGRTIFGPDPLDKSTNLIRAAELRQIEISKIQNIMSGARFYPFFLAEMLGRLIATDKIGIIAQNRDILRLIGETSNRLRELNIANISLTDPNDPIISARNILILSMIRIINDETSAKLALVDQIFMTEFCRYLYEGNLSPMLLFSYLQSYGKYAPPNNKADFLLDSIFSRCLKEPNNDGYLSLVTNISSIMADQIQEFPHLIVQYRRFLPSIFAYLSKASNHSLLDSAIQFVVSMTAYFGDSTFDLTDIEFNSLVSAIKNNTSFDNFSSNNINFIKLFNAMCGIHIREKNDPRYIKHYSIVGIIYVGYSEALSVVLKEFDQLINETKCNIARLQRSNLDNLLTTTIKNPKKEQIYRGKKFNVKISDEDIDNIAKPLLVKIMTTQSSYPILNSFLSFKEGEEITDDLLSEWYQKLDFIIRHQRGEKRGKIEIGTVDAQIKIEGITGEQLANGYAISMFIEPDLIPLLSTTAVINLFDLRDSQKNRIQVLFNSSSIQFYYDSSKGSRSMMSLVSRLANDHPFRATFIFIPNAQQQQQSLIVTGINGILTTSQVSNLFLAPGSIDVYFGGYSFETRSSCYDNIEMGYISDISFYGRRFSSDEAKSIPQNPKSLLFYSPDIDPILEGKLDIPNPNNWSENITISQTKNGNKHITIRGLTITVSGMRRWKDRSEYQITEEEISSSIFSLLSEFKATKRIDIKNTKLQYLLSLLSHSLSNGSKPHFRDQSRTLMLHLRRIPDSLTYSVYRTFEGITTQISDPLIAQAWFNNIVANPTLWSSSGIKLFAKITKRWSYVFFNELWNYVEGHGFFGRFLTYIRDKMFSDTTLKPAREDMFLLVRRLGSLSLSSEEARLLISLLKNSTATEETILALDIIKTAYKSLRQYDCDYFTPLRPKIRSNNPIIALKAIEAVHQLGDFHSKVGLIQKSLVPFDSRNPNNCTRRKVFTELCNDMKQYANIFSLVCAISAENWVTDDERRTMMAMILSGTDQGLELDGPWYFWAVCASHVIGTVGTPLHAFLATTAMKSNDPKQQSLFISQIMTGIFLTAPPERPDPCASFASQTLSLLESFQSDNTREPRESLFLSLGVALLLQRSSHFSEKIIQMLNDSGISRGKNPLSPQQTQNEISTETPNESPSKDPLLSIINKLIGYSQIEFEKDLKLRLRIQEGELMDISTLQNFTECYKDFMAKSHPSWKEVAMFLTSMIHGKKQIEPQLKWNSQKNCLTSFPDFDIDLRAHLKAARLTISLIAAQAMDEWRSNEIKVDLKTGFVGAQQTSTLRRSKTVNSHLVPAIVSHVPRFNISNNTPEENTALKPEDGENCLYLTMYGNKHAQYLFMPKEGIKILKEGHSHFITFDEFRFIFARSFPDNSSGIEFILHSGKTFLLKFSNNLGIDDSYRRISNFPLSQMKMLEFGQKSAAQTQSYISDLAKLWNKSDISAFDLLIKLNLITNHSFNCKDIYPIFPSIFENVKSRSFRFEKGIIFDETKRQKPYSSEMLERTLEVVGENGNLIKMLESGDGILPEFYFLFDSIKNDDELPNWAKTRFELIYKLRTSLESNGYIDQVGSWICRSLLRTPQLIFERETENTIQQLVPELNLNTKLKAAVFINKEKMEKTDKILVTLSESGEANLHSIALEKEHKMNFSLGKGSKPISGVTGRTFLLNDGIMVFSTPSEGRKVTTVKYLPGGIEEKFQLAEMKANKIAGQLDCILFCSSPYCVMKGEQGILSTPQLLFRTKSPISCIAAGIQSKIVAVNLMDGSVSIHSLRTGSLVRNISLGEIGHEMIVTEKWGFIVLRGYNRLIVLSSDGDVISINDIPHNFVRIIGQISGRNGADYVVFEDDKKTLKYFEVMSPTKIQVIGNPFSDLTLSIKYDLRFNRFLRIGTLGQLTIINQELTSS